MEGNREITRALEAGVEFREVYVCQKSRKKTDIPATSSRDVADLNFEKFTDSKISVYEVNEAIFSKISYGNRTEGVLAVCSPSLTNLYDLPSKKSPFFVVIEGVEKPGNLGAILRTCDGAGVDGVIICDGKTDIYNPNVIRSSLGAVFSLNVIVASGEDAVQFLRKEKINIYAALPGTKSIYTNPDLRKGTAVVVGSEQKGLTAFWSQHADCKVRIPMKGRVDSLNVSAATAILLYEVIRQRSQ